MAGPVTQGAQVRHLTIDETHVGQRLDNYLLAVLKGVPRTYIYRVIRKGEVRVNSARATPATRLQEGDKVRVPPVRTARKGELPRGLSARWRDHLSSPLFEDEDLLVLDKPSGLPVHAGSGVPAGLIEILRDVRDESRYLELVHRLDRGTSGCLIIAKKRSILRELNNILKVNSYTNYQIEKDYTTLVKGTWTDKKDIRHPLLKVRPESGERVVVLDPEGQYAHSRFAPMDHFGNATLMKVNLYTGRTHQVRVHAASEGHPVAGDEKYGDQRFNRGLRSLGLARLFLHAGRIAFPHPTSGKRIEVTSSLPKDLANVLKKLGVEG